MEDPNFPTPEEVVIHEIGHLLVGDVVGRTLRRIEWVAHPDGRPHAQAVMSDTAWCRGMDGAELDAQTGRLMIAVAGSVAVAITDGQELSLDILDDGPCEHDRNLAKEAARRIVELDPERSSPDEVIVEALDAAAQILRSEDNQWIAGELKRRLLELRDAKPLGLVVLDSRELDEIMRRIEALWVDPVPPT